MPPRAALGGFHREDRGTLLIADIATGEPVGGADIELAAVEGIESTSLDEILEAQGELVGSTSPTGCIEVPINADHDLVFFAATNVYFDPVGCADQVG